MTDEQKRLRRNELLRQRRATPEGKARRQQEHKQFYQKYKEKYSEYKKFLYDLRMEWGGKCSHCGYNREVKILHFHHLRDKLFQVCSYRGLITEKVKARIRAEAEKCILLCPNCHSEIHIAHHAISQEPVHA